MRGEHPACEPPAGFPRLSAELGATLTQIAGSRARVRGRSGRIPDVKLALFILGLALAGAAWLPARGEASVLSRDQLGVLLATARDSTHAAEALGQCRALIAGTGERRLQDSEAGVVRMALVSALITLRAPLPELAASADTLFTLIPAETQGSNAVGFAVELIRHPHTLSLAPRYATRGLELLPPGPESAQPRGDAEMVLALDCLNRNLADSAIVHWSRALPDRPDSQVVLAQLGSACAKAGREPEAIGYWIRAAAVFGASDTSFAAPLRVLYLKRNRSLGGLETAIAEARAVSRQRVALDPQRVDEPAPDWTLKDLEGHSVSLGALKGKIVVLDFWGSWCGPCRRELPHFEQLYSRYRGGKVAFLSVNVEMERTEAGHIEKARAFIEQNHYSFPVLPDHEGVAVTAHGINNFPTLLLIDPAGRIRYRNIGYRDGFDDVIAAQLAEMMK